ncbi:hypothetical protein [Micromonospora sp. KC721]|uniref:hypothetical protein n=1 Tax=Micromonospora sp. KC721 TaxID=2530380 RepID=UPI00104F4587|nr:hypothetical protein [Micromonospora sp. KC721]TDB80942.1 hypothetical protein E1182_07005 [Micromonospora sp. KC721]
MRALVGRFAPGAGWYRARPVELEGQPTWTLPQLRAMWDGRFQRDTERMVTALLRRDWSVLAATEWPADVVDVGRMRWRYVAGVGRGLHDSMCGRAVVGLMRNDERFDDECWAYLWEHQMETLHVWAAHHGRWHHLATLPDGVWTGLTPQLVVDVEARWCWLAREER